MRSKSTPDTVVTDAEVCTAVVRAAAELAEACLCDLSAELAADAYSAVRRPVRVAPDLDAWVPKQPHGGDVVRGWCAALRPEVPEFVPKRPELNAQAVPFVPEYYNETLNSTDYNVFDF